MGVLIVDHRGTVDPTGTKDGTLVEMDTRQCPHCQATLLVKLQGTRKFVDTPHRCDRCSRPICPECARIMATTRVCPGPLRERIDRAYQGMRARDSVFYNMSR